MASISHDVRSTGCGIGIIATMQHVGYQAPEETLKALFQKQSRYIGGKYQNVAYFGSGYRWIHVYFSDYTKEHYKEIYKADPPKGSGELLAAYITENNLGTITRSPAMFNPAHPERDGKDPVYAYIWTLDNEKGIEEWAKKHKLL